MPSEPISIPDISDDRLRKLMLKIKPVQRTKDGFKIFHGNTDPRRTSFLWVEEFENRVVYLEPLQEVKTLHKYGFYGYFKPSIAEVLAQMPPHLEAEAVAFECDGPNSLDDMTLFQEEFDAGFHVACTTFYRVPPRRSLLQALMGD